MEASNTVDDQLNALARSASESVMGTVAVGPRAYAMGIIGNELAPDLNNGQRAVFDPDAGPARGRGIVALWLHGKTVPFVVKLATAVPPGGDWGEDLEPMLMIASPGGCASSIAMSRVARVDRMVDVVSSGEVAHG